MGVGLGTGRGLVETGGGRGDDGGGLGGTATESGGGTGTGGGALDGCGVAEQEALPLKTGTIWCVSSETWALRY